ncbi:PhzF family phenazine biosynthesis protein [Amphiplicatus metriothermophilus]|uniref:Trans-2,3-dihydro-3-hydroxyanthranilate isomerase n=1 Tax=Amphiplicatus metriothermophilus TaxID=1519374 RepID=A0A239PZF7_9PROT|nr:PhzF family phenazine biosynthesis protein [Amphiplicatus metriothermophilus]MBB5518184.1 trans-2,3-dihydro-3-hydroxyanthranilate isomerase [Amphiplicatus metriothermophilus]SNT75346.1 trans-2,3-dihydro-3-hydroxyanthranilate isomerase [Amphiplicatus metriothermophilus]
MRSYAFETWDVFTDRRFAGNPLAVVTDARGLSDEEMQLIAREFNLAETAFVLPPDDPAHTARARIFTPAYEMPFAGHPTVGTAIAIATARGLDGLLLLELKAGLFPVAVERAGAAAFAEFENPNPPRERGPAPAVGLIEAALSLPEGALDRAAHKPRRIGAGVDFVYARASLEAVRAARLDNAAWARLDLAGVVGVLLYAEGGEAADAAYHARMFAPDAGVFEDPATGSAACALPGQIALSGALADGAHDWIVEQGFEMGRPSRIRVRFETKGGEAGRVRVGGQAVPVSAGQLAL